MMLKSHMKIGEQLMEVLQRTRAMINKLPCRESVKMLDAVSRQKPKNAWACIHRVFSGMRQRVMIAMALLCRPKLLIADNNRLM